MRLLGRGREDLAACQPVTVCVCKCVCVFVWGHRGESGQMGSGVLTDSESHLPLSEARACMCVALKLAASCTC